MSNLLGPNGRINVNMTKTVQALADQLKLYTKLQNFFNVGGVNGEPMLTIAANINQRLLIKRMAWKFNRVNLGSNNPAENPHFIMTQQGFQDFKHAGATCFTLINSTTPGGQLPAGGAGVDLVPGVYQNANAKVAYGPMNGGTAGVVYDPASDTITVQFLDPHPFQIGNIGTSVVLISGVTNPAFNSQFVYNQLTQFSGWANGYTIVSIPDNLHIVLQPNGGQSNIINAISVSGSVTTITLAQNNPVIVYNPPQNPVGPANTTGNGIAKGFVMTFTGVGTNTALNGKTVTLLSATENQLTFTTPAGVTITPGSETGKIYAANSGAPGIFNFGWAEAGQLVDINNNTFPLPVSAIDAVHRTAPEYTSTGAEVMSISAEIDYGNGVIKFRISEPVSTYPFAFLVTYQAKAPKFTSGQSIFQWPDDLSFVLFELGLWEGMRFAYGTTAAETQTQMQAAMIAVQSALESEDREANDMALTPSWSIFR